MSSDTHPQGIPRNSWLIHTSEGVIHADGIVPPVPSLARGDSGTFSFRIYTDQYHGQDPPAYPDHLDRYETLLEMDEHAGSYVDHRTPNNEIIYQEQRPGGVPELLVKLEPVYETGVRGVWGLLDSVEDETTMESELVDLDITVMKLANADAYDDRIALQSDLENGGP